MFSLGFVSALPFTPWNHVYNTLLCNCTCIITFFRLRPFHVSCIVSRHRIKLTVNHLSACEVVTSPFCGLLRHCFYNLQHWLISWYLKIFDDFSVVSWLLSFWVFVKEQFCIFCPAVGDLWQCVCSHHWFRFPGSSCCLLSGCQSRPQLPTTAPPRPEAAADPSISPSPSSHLLWS